MVDVGSRNGESLEEFVRWDFDRIYSFEPMPVQHSRIRERFADDPRVVAYGFGLSDMTGLKHMYGADEHGEASVFATKSDLDASVVSEARFLEAALWFAYVIDDDDDVWLKLNCEGSEVAILNNLMDRDELRRVKAFRVEFDISRVRGHEHEADLLLARLDEYGYTDFTIGSDARFENGGLVDRVPQVGTHHGRLHDWLESVW
jgi:FkbM family methyltransferase